MKLLMLIIGFILAVFGGVSLVAYLNLLIVGYSLQEYLMFLLKRVETYMFITGLATIWLTAGISRLKKRQKIKLKK